MTLASSMQESVNRLFVTHSASTAFYFAFDARASCNAPLFSDVQVAPTVGSESFYMIDTGALVGFYGAAVDANARLSYAVAIPSDTWVHIGAIADGAGNVDLYYNGALVATKTGFGALTSQAGGLLFVGNTTGITSPQTVNVNLLTIGARRWSKEHMAWLYNGGAGRKYPF